MRAFALLMLIGPPPLLAQEVRLERPTLPAAGQQRTHLTVDPFGRYAIEVKSAAGVSLQLVDRMAGPREAAGQPGEQDGRLDVFLERGEYRLLTEGHPRATGEAKLGARAFAELSLPEPPQLLETKLVETTLADYEQRSYWLPVKERRRVALEAAGRNLADLRLWRDGQWLVDATPATERVQPRVGQPLLACRLTADLEPGLYKVVAYGGPPQPWAEEADAHPLYIRLGLPRLPEAGRRRFTMSPFGVDRFLAPGAATYFRLELPEALPAILRAGDLVPEAPFSLPSEQRDISKKSLPPVAEVDLPAAPDAEPRRAEEPPLPDRIVTVEATAGQAYVLQQFDRRSIYNFRADGEYLVSSVHSGDPQDSVDATALLLKSGDKEPLREDVVLLDGKTPWSRRANLLAPLTVFLRVKETGRYEVVLEGAQARARLEPFLTYRPNRYQPPAFKGSGSVWDLDAGFYVLTAEPVKRGIVTFTVRAAGAAAATARAARGEGALFPSVRLDRDHGYTLYLNEQPEVRSGIQLRRLPVDPTEPVFLSQKPGDALSLPVTVAEPGLLRAEAEDGTLFDLVVDGVPALKAAALAPGVHTVALKNDGAASRRYCLVFEPARLSRASALPPLPAEEGPIALEALAPGAERFLDLEAGASATYGVRADEAGLYVLESTGLLSTEGNLRSRVVTSLARDSAGGTGRNFELRQYLREGDYQVTVRALAPSAGHLGLTLRRTETHDGGFLLSRLPARATMKGGAAVAYRFVITKPGEFRVRALGLGRSLRCRLEDEEGWPLVPPDGPADVTRYFEPGRYRFLVLPEATDARVVSVIEPVVRRRVRTGHGPHRLPLGDTVEHEWREPEQGQERLPDVWELALPAATDVTFALSSGMEGDVFGPGGSTPLLKLQAGPPSKVALEAGRYRIEVRSERQNNRAPYTLQAFPEALLAGMERVVQLPVEVPVAVGEAGLVELSSFGDVDVKARLYDAQGVLVAGGDDRPDDWNFQITSALRPGRYVLRVDPVGVARGTTSIRLRAPREEEKAALVLPARADVQPKGNALLFPLSGVKGELLLLQARSVESLGLAVEERLAEGWIPLGSASGRDPRLEVPLREGPAKALRVRLWSLDRRDEKAQLAVTSLNPPRIKEDALRRGARLAAVQGLPGSVAAAVVEVERPGLLRVAEPAGLRFADEPGVACRSAPNGLVGARGRRLYVVSDAAAPLRAERVALGPLAPLVVEMPAQGVPVEVQASAGPLVVKATSRSLQPGLRLGEAGALPTRGPMATSPGFAVAVALRAKKPLVVAYAATPGSATRAGLGDATLEATSVPAPRSVRLAAGVTDGQLTGLTAVAYALPSGGKRMRVALSSHTVAVLSEGDAILSVLASGEDMQTETFYTNASTLTLLHTTEGPGRFSVEAVADPPRTVQADRPLELALAEAGSLRLDVATTEGATLRVRGAVQEALFTGEDGQVRRGLDFAVAGAGALTIRHGRGPLLVWLEREGVNASSLWDVPEVAVRDVALPARVNLEGPGLRLGLSPTEPALVQVRSATPLVSVLTRPGALPQVAVHTEGARLDVVLPAERSELLLRPALPGPLQGTAELLATPVVKIVEGLGPEVVLPPGSSRAFTFTVTDGGPVGLGVRASEEVVEATLFDAAFHPLGAGLAQMPTLAPGAYVLVVHAPAEGRTISVRPAVAGLVQPTTDPPIDVARRYLEPVEAPSTFSSRRVEETPEFAEAEGEEPPGGDAGEIDEEQPEDEPPPEREGPAGGAW